MARDRLCELVSSLASCRVSEQDFDIGLPSVVKGVRTSVMIRPRNSTRRYGFRQITYNRFDLSTMKPLELLWRGEQSTRDVARRPDLGALQLYRLAVPGVPGFSTPRTLYLRAEDVVDEPVQATTTLTRVLLQAHETSDLFVGSWEITLRRV